MRLQLSLSIHFINEILISALSITSAFQTPHPSLKPILYARTSALNGNIYDAWSQDILSTTQSDYTFDDLQMAVCDEEVSRIMECEFSITN